MIRPLILAAALLAPAAAVAQAPLPPASTAPAVATPPSVGADPAYGQGGQGGGRMNMSPEMRQARRGMMQACAADMAQFCADAQAGGGARLQCVRAHASELSEGCRSALQSFRAARQGATAAPPMPQN